MIGLTHAAINANTISEPEVCQHFFQQQQQQQVQANDLLSISYTMFSRLKRLFNGEYQTLDSFSFSAPSEYLGMLGLSYIYQYY